jgi:hypothetical protein
MSTSTSLAHRPRQPVLTTSQRLPIWATIPFSAISLLNYSSTCFAPAEMPPVPWQMRILTNPFSLMTKGPLLE